MLLFVRNKFLIIVNNLNFPHSVLVTVSGCCVRTGAVLGSKPHLRFSIFVSSASLFRLLTAVCCSVCERPFGRPLLRLLD